MGIELDATDVQLLEALQQDCKASLSRLGAQVGLTAPSVMERVRKLETAGVITGYHARVDGALIGLDITAFVGVSFNFQKGIDRFRGAVNEMPGVLECHHVTGAHTMLVKVKAPNTATLEELISSFRDVEGVTRTETMVVLSTQRESGHVPLDHAETAPPKRRKRK